MDYLDTVSRFICETKLEDLGAEALAHGRWVIADSIPVIAAGMQTPEMRALVEKHLANAAPGTAWVLGTGRTAGVLDAGLLNGTAGTWLELDEGNQFAKGHPGIQVVPAALAVAQEMGASGADLLVAVVLGYEISGRISRAANMKLTIHPHGTYGVIGAAIAVGKLKGFNPAQMRCLINMSATMGMATSRNTLLEGSTVRNIYTGHAAFMGQMAARMVEAGFTGEVDGVKSIYAGVLSDTFDSARVIDGLGSEWLMTQGYFKLHPTGRYVHSAIDALEDALTSLPGGRMDPTTIRRIDVSAYKLAAMLDGKNITTSFGARFSIPFALASILYHGQSGLASFDDAAVANPAVQSLVARIFVREELTFTAAYPQKNLCDIVITLNDGSTLAGHCELTKGEQENPHTDAELEGKFFILGDAVWGTAKTRTLYDACMRLEAIRNVGEFAAGLSL